MRAPRASGSLQNRLLLLVLCLALVVWLGAAALTWRDAQHELDELLDGHLAQTAALLLTQAQGDHDDVSDAPLLHKYAPQVVFQVFIEGALITRSANAPAQALSTQTQGFSNLVREDGTRWRVFAAQNPQQEILVLVGETQDARQSILWAVMRSLLGPLLLALPLLGLGLWWSVRQGLAPIRALGHALAQRQPQDTEPVRLQPLPRELQTLVHTLNGLLQRVERMLQTERRFTADAAHELRTPIAAIRAQAQVAMGAGDDAAEREHALQTTLAGCDRASHLVEQLLTLARLEAAPASPAPVVDLCAVVRRVAAELAPAALARQQQITVLADAPCLVGAQEVLAGVLVRNLLDNALRYSTDGAQVQLRVQAQDGATCLQVQDSGPGLSAEALSHLGERFFRVLGNPHSGSGLGWSIVRRLLEVFGARVDVGRSQELGGLAVSVHWPPAPAQERAAQRASTPAAAP